MNTTKRVHSPSPDGSNKRPRVPTSVLAATRHRRGARRLETTASYASVDLPIPGRFPTSSARSSSIGTFLESLQYTYPPPPFVPTEGSALQLDSSQENMDLLYPDLAYSDEAKMGNVSSVGTSEIMEEMLELLEDENDGEDGEGDYEMISDMDFDDVNEEYNAQTGSYVCLFTSTRVFVSGYLHRSSERVRNIPIKVMVVSRTDGDIWVIVGNIGNSKPVATLPINEDCKLVEDLAEWVVQRTYRVVRPETRAADTFETHLRLSFESDQEFGAFKRALEGPDAQRSDDMLVYEGDSWYRIYEDFLDYGSSFPFGRVVISV
ncbi:hypothetical protein VKT23_015083 [Stygiomarasmius scandens]|uniref:Uncharacterized protein n=1 Tax=Marasmiellus scandens TaxID=2682957 RepID=A0ABR1J347_9AGAR